MKGIVFRVTNPDGRVFYGYRVKPYNASNLQGWFASMIRTRRLTGTIARSLRKHGIDAHTFTVVDVLPANSLPERARQLQYRFRRILLNDRRSPGYVSCKHKSK